MSVADLDDALLELRRLWASSGTVTDPDLGTVEQSTILICRVIARADGDGDVSVSDVARGLDVAHSTGSRLVDRAVRVGAVRRSASTTDARRTVLHLTAAGRRLHHTATTFRHGYLTSVLATWSAADQTLLATLLTRFADAVGNQPLEEPT